MVQEDSMAQEARQLRCRRGWDKMTEEERKAWKKSKHAEAQELTTTVAEFIVSLIDKGKTERDLGWTEQWVPPQNIIYGNRYVGLNALALTAQARARGQKDCRFLTARALTKLKDAEGHQARLKEGAQPYLVMSPRKGQDRRLDARADTSSYESDRLEQREDGTWLKGRIYFSSVRVYSIADTTAVAPPLATVPRDAFTSNDFLDKVIAACGARVVHGSTNGAYFSKTEDCIHMPDKSQFHSAPMYYATLCHEFFHWTGMAERENRDLSLFYADTNYIKEELRAELFAAISSIMFGLPGTMGQSAGYIHDWNRCLANNPKDILAMAAEVQRVTCALYDVADKRRPKLGWLKDCDFSEVPAPVWEARKKGVDLEEKWRRDMGLEERLCELRKSAARRAESMDEGPRP